ncbi:MAG: DUF971 domain-containing protein [Planctomycetota bacterium]
MNDPGAHSPISLERRDESTLRIAWSDGMVRDYPVRELRDKCPCATCREKRDAPPPPANALTVLSMEETQPLRITGMRPVGSYAYGIQFSDGHNTGLFTLTLLRQLGSEATPDE